MEQKNSGDLLLQFFDMPKAQADIVTVWGGKIVAPKAEGFMLAAHKAVYLNWILNRIYGDSFSDDVVEQGDAISSGTVSLDFDSEKYNIIGYEITLSYNDGVGKRPVAFSHKKKDINPGASTEQEFTFTVKPGGDEVQILYLENWGTGTKYLPLVNKTNQFLPSTASANAKGISQFVCTGPNGCEVSILPITELSEQVANLAGNYQRFMRMALK